jgi:prolipoprotein diacylglyceryl transferase
MFPILNLGGLAIQTPGLFLLAGIWLGINLIERQARHMNLDGERINNLLFLAFVAGLLGARLAYALRYLQAYLQDPLGLFSLNPSALAPFEGLLIACLAALIYGQRRRLQLWPTLDALTPGLALFAIFLGLAHFASGDAFGAPGQVPWTIELWGAQRHPSQIYEILAAALILILIWRGRSLKAPAGTLFLGWLGLSAAARLFLEAFRGDSLIVFETLRAAQLVSLGLLLVCLWALHLRARSATHSKGDDGYGPMGYP